MSTIAYLHILTIFRKLAFSIPRFVTSLYHSSRALTVCELGGSAFVENSQILRRRKAYCLMKGATRVFEKLYDDQNILKAIQIVKEIKITENLVLGP